MSRLKPVQFTTSTPRLERSPDPRRAVARFDVTVRDQHGVEWEGEATVDLRAKHRADVPAVPPGSRLCGYKGVCDSPSCVLGCYLEGCEQAELRR